VPIPALTPTLIESELFGHVKGAFTEAARDKKGRLELADGGVLFLDEVGDIEPALQPKLLRFLDSGELYRVGETTARHVDALAVSATNRPLERLVEEGRFRDDLLARLGHSLRVPPLRERPEDVPLLVEHFLEMHQRGDRRRSFSPEALERMQAYRWEFNVRQLQQVVEYAVCIVDRDEVRADDLPDFLKAPRPDTTVSPDNPTAPSPPPLAGPPSPLREVVEAAEREHLLRALEYTGGNRRRAIELLQIAPETFYRRLEEFGLHKKRSG
jgi:two-component system response regulator AtoC